ncbi:hypothetical protein [Leptothrix ochracea]|uniref:hypothetical protein n=1 Tax=Leptothrix ochracea TaxID=735331 RepID=UPI0034E19E0C
MNKSTKFSPEVRERAVRMVHVPKSYTAYLSILQPIRSNLVEEDGGDVSEAFVLHQPFGIVDFLRQRSTFMRR